MVDVAYVGVARRYSQPGGFALQERRRMGLSLKEEAEEGNCTGLEAALLAYAPTMPL